MKMLTCLAIVVTAVAASLSSGFAGTRYDWTPVTLNGFCNPNNTILNSSAVFNDHLYVGTWNRAQGCLVYRVRLEGWEADRPLWHVEQVCNRRGRIP